MVLSEISINQSMITIMQKTSFEGDRNLGNRKIAITMKMFPGVPISNSLCSSLLIKIAIPFVSLLMARDAYAREEKLSFICGND